MNDLGLMVSHPVIDPYVLPAPPYDAFTAGVQNDVPILIGSNADEARSLVDVTQIRAATFENDITKRFGALPPQLLAAYPHTTEQDAVTARLGFERDLRFGWDIWTWARLQAGHSHKPVFAYHFEQRPPFPENSAYAGWGPSHYSELWYCFDHLNQEAWAWGKSDRLLARTMSRYWVNFARGGDPNGGELPIWPPFDDVGQRVLYLGDSIRVGAVAHLEPLTVFDTVYSRLRALPADRE